MNNNYDMTTYIYIYIYIYISAVKFQILCCSRELQILKFCSRELQIFKKISSSRELQISHI